jgi:hypothetical protein
VPDIRIVALTERKRWDMAGELFFTDMRIGYGYQLNGKSI